jgi:cytoskeletal protein CcmA (bactofilin family)
MARTIMSVFSPQTGRASGADAADTETAAASTPEPVQRSVMTLGKTLSFKGELFADEDMVLLGRVEGSITHTESLTVGASGVVIGDLSARVLTIKGTVEGDLEASEAIVISPSANVLGDLVAPRVSIVEGAVFNGRVVMKRAAPVAATKPDESAAAAPAKDVVADDKAVDQMLSSR